MVSGTRFHRRRHVQSLVNPAKIVVHGMEHSHVSVVLGFFAECIRQASKAPPPHPTYRRKGGVRAAFA